MKELTYFKLAQCPYCRRADQWIKELIEEKPEYKSIKIRTILEDVEADLADQYDYYYVPSFYSGDKKLHEGAATKEIIKKVMDRFLA